MQTKQFQVDNAAARLFFKRKAVGLISIFKKPSDTRLDAVFSDHIDAARQKYSDGQMMLAFRLLKKAASFQPSQSIHSWEFASLSMDVASRLCEKRFYLPAIELLEKVLPASEGDQKPRLEARIREIRESASNNILDDARSVVRAHPNRVVYISTCLGKATEIVPWKKDEINHDFVFIEGSKQSVYVSRKTFEAASKKL